MSAHPHHPQQTPRPGRILSLLLLLAAVLAVYGQTILFPRLGWDDPSYIGAEPRGRPALSFGILEDAFSRKTAEQHFGYRPMQLLSYRLDELLFAGADFGHHLTNVLLHVFVIWTLFRFLRRLLRLQFGREELDAERIAFWASLLFAVFPYHLEAVAWISERKGLLAFLFLLLAADLDLSWRDRGRVRHLLGSSSLYALSLLSKSMWVSWPGVALLLAMTGRKTISHPNTRRAFVAVPIYLVLAVGAAVMQLSVGNAENVMPLGQTSAERLLFMLATYAYYLAAFLRPTHTMPVNEWAWRGLPGWGWLLLSGVAVAGLLAASVIAWRRGMRWPAAAAGWFFLSLAPVSNLVPMLYPHGDRFLYGPSLAVLVPLGGLSALLARKRGLPLPVLIVLFYAVPACIGTHYWRSSVALWDYGVAMNPDSQVAHYNLGMVYRQYPEHRDRALAEFRRALEPAPGARFHASTARAALHNLLALTEQTGDEQFVAELCARYADAPRFPPEDRWRCRIRLAGILRAQGAVREAERLLSGMPPGLRARLSSRNADPGGEPAE